MIYTIFYYSGSTEHDVLTGQISYTSTTAFNGNLLSSSLGTFGAQSGNTYYARLHIYILSENGGLIDFNSPIAGGGNYGINVNHLTFSTSWCSGSECIQ